MNRYRIHKSWDDVEADWCYRLQIKSNDNDEYESTIYHGNAEWAESQADHYKCEIVSDENSDEVKT